MVTLTADMAPAKPYYPKCRTAPKFGYYTGMWSFVGAMAAIGPMKGVIPTPDIAKIFHPTPDIKAKKCLTPTLKIYTFV